jgi:hypothetical protein
VFWRLWLVFFLAASAGLMVLSQAAGIIAAYGGATALAVYGTTFIAGTIAAARLAGGWMVDWLTIPSVAAGAQRLGGIKGVHESGQKAPARGQGGDEASRKGSSSYGASAQRAAMPGPAVRAACLGQGLPRGPGAGQNHGPGRRPSA